MSEEKQKPAAVIRDGNISASIWERKNGNETYYATTYAKTYKDEHGNYQTSHSFYGSEHLKLAELSKQVYQRERELCIKSRQNTQPEPQREPERERV